MAIQKLTAATEITKGQWVCETAVMRDGICGHPRQVVKASGQRVYLTDRHGEDYGHFIARKSVVFVCDTREEAAAVHAISSAQLDAISSATKQIKAGCMAKIDALSASDVILRDYQKAAVAALVATLPAPAAPQVPDMALLIARLSYALKQAAPGHELPSKATAYLTKHDLIECPLRTALRAEGAEQ